MPISMKLNTNYLCVKGIQNCTNQGPGSLEKGDNNKSAKIGQMILKISSRTTKLENLRFAQKPP
jgi:hypothetical protein